MAHLALGYSHLARLGCEREPVQRTEGNGLVADDRRDPKQQPLGANRKVQGLALALNGIRLDSPSSKAGAWPPRVGGREESRVGTARPWLSVHETIVLNYSCVH